MKVQLDKKDIAKVKRKISVLEKSFTKDFVSFGGSTEKISVKGFQEIQNNIRTEKFKFTPLSPFYLLQKKLAGYPLRFWEKTSAFINALSRFQRGRSWWAGVQKGLVNRDGEEIADYVLENEAIRPILRSTAFGTKGDRSFLGNGFQNFADIMWVKSVKSIIRNKWKK